jgi:hypothetical protein
VLIAGLVFVAVVGTVVMVLLRRNAASFTKEGPRLSRLELRALDRSVGIKMGNEMGAGRESAAQVSTDWFWMDG